MKYFNFRINLEDITVPFQSSVRSLEPDRQQQSLLPKASGSTARQVREYIPKSGMKKYNHALSNLIPIRYQNQYVLSRKSFIVI